MSAIMKLRQARSVEQIAEELEPLAMSLATLADQASASIKELEDASQRQAHEWSDQQSRAASEVRTAAAHIGHQSQVLQQVTASLQATAEAMQRAQRGQLWTLMTVAVLSAILAAALSIASWVWLKPAPAVQNTLDAKAVAEHLRAPLTEAFKRR